MNRSSTGPLYGALREFCSRCKGRIAVGAHGAPARSGAGHGAPASDEPGCGAPNAAAALGTPVWGRAPREMDTVQTDLIGALHATRHAIDAMRRRGGGAIVNIASISALWHGLRFGGGAPAYEVAKAGLIRLTTTLEWLAKSDPIRVNCLAPGWIAPTARGFVF